MLLTGVRAARRPRNLGGNCRGGRFGFSGGSYRKLYSVLSADLVYVLLFPQLLLIIHWKAHCNSYGSIVSMLTGFIFRILGTVIETKLFY